jgi:hypothetical protein
MGNRFPGTEHFEHYVVPKDTLLYKGFSATLAQNNCELNPAKAPYWFALNESISMGYAKGYGATLAVYRLNDTVRLLKMDSVTNLKKIYELANDNLKEVLSKAFYFDKDNNIARNSEMMNDKLLGQVCCYFGFNGYYAGPIGKDENAFPEELMLCDPKHVTLVSCKTLNPNFKQSLFDLINS